MPRFLLLLVGQMLTATLIAAAPGSKAPAKADPAAAEAIRKALDSSGNFDFSGVNLPGVLNTIAEQYKINIVLDRTVLQQMGLDPNHLSYFYNGLDQKLVGVEGAEPIAKIIS